MYLHLILNVAYQQNICVLPFLWNHLLGVVENLTEDLLHQPISNNRTISLILEVKINKYTLLNNQDINS